MNSNRLRQSVLITLLLTLPLQTFARSSGPDDDLTNSPPNRQNCTACHSSFGFNSGRGSLNLQGLPETYEPGETYHLTIELADPDARRWGFEITSLTDNNSRAGNIDVTDQQGTQLSNGNNRPQYLKQRSAGTYQGQANNASWQLDWTAPAEGTGTVTFYYCGNAANNNGNNTGDRIYGSSSELAEAEPPPPPPPPDSAMVSLMIGWNLISSPVAPDSMAISSIFMPLIDAGQLIMVRNSTGETFDPAGDINDIGEWNPYESYQVKVSEDTELKFAGMFADTANVYMIQQGWNWISYPRLDTLNPTQLIDIFGFAAVELRNGEGRFAIPGLGVSNLGWITSGNGLQVLSAVEEPYEFVWPVPNRELEPPLSPESPTHFENPAPTSFSMSLMVQGWNLSRDISDGDELAAMTMDGLTVGSGVVTGDTLLFSIRGDDPTTEIADGASEGDTLLFTYWFSDRDSEEVTTALTINDQAVLYEEGRYAQIILTTPPPNTIGSENIINISDFRLIGVSPNPFNPTAEVSFEIPEQSDVSINLFDISGRFIRGFGVSHYEAGAHSVAISGNGLPAGLYLIGVENRGSTKLTRALLLK